MIKMVPLHTAILFALEETDSTSGIGEQMMLRWAKKAEIEIGLQRMYRKLKYLILDANYIDPPDDAINIKYIYDGDVTDELKVSIGDGLVGDDYNDSMTAMHGYVWSPLSDSYVPENMWDMQGGQLIFDPQKVGKGVTIDYTAFPTNDDNDIIVPEFHLDAVSFYVQYRMSRALRWKQFRSPKMMRGNEIMTVREMKDEWIRERNKARAENAAMTPFDKKMIDAYFAEMTGSFIHNFE
jgi:hypothetical protein